MSQNQSYFWQTTRRNVYLKRSAKLQMLLALLAVLTFSTVCLAEINPYYIEENGVTVGIDRKTTSADGPMLGQPDAFDANEKQNADVPKDAPISNVGFVDAFTASISVILVTELGDKTFFIAAIMAMSHSRLVVFAGAIFALALMTVLSVVFGMAATIIPKVYTYYISTALFFIFGLKMIYEGYVMKPTDVQEELQEVQSDLRKRQDELMGTKREKYEGGGLDPKRKNSNSDSDKETDVFLENGKQPYESVELTTFSTTKKPENNCDNEFINSNISDTKNTQEIKRKKYGNRAAVKGSMTMVHSSSNAKTKGCTLSLKSQNSTRNVAKNSEIGLENGKRRLERNNVSQDPETGSLNKSSKKSPAYLNTRVFMQAFTMTFLAEWGDRSQLTTIILAASKNIYGVITGGIIGHAICTSLAVIGGRMVAAKISVKTVTIVGGIVFLGFALYALIVRPDDI